MQLIKQMSPKSCNIACLQMVGNYFGKLFTETDIVKKLPQHAFGNWLTEMALFLEDEEIPTHIYTNAPIIPTSLQTTMEQYKKRGNVHIAPISESIFTGKPAILNLDRAKLYNTGNKKAPHYVVILKENNRLLVYDPKNNEPVEMPYETIYQASLDINEAGDNGMFLVTL